MDYKNRDHSLLHAGPWYKLKEKITDQRLGIKNPEQQKRFNDPKRIISLPGKNIFEKELDFIKKDYLQLYKDRRSIRQYSNSSITFQELTFLLFTTQGIIRGDKKRPAPSGGARYPIDTYIAVGNTQNINPGVYRYLSKEHCLELVYNDEDIIDKVADASFSNYYKQQSFISSSSIIFIWVAIPYRSEWRYDNLASKLIILEAGHICQNLYLSAETLDIGVCAIGAYNQEKIDNLLKLREQELTVYMATAGKNI